MSRWLPLFFALSFTSACGGGEEEAPTLRGLRCVGDYATAAETVELVLLEMIEADDAPDDIATEQRLLDFLRTVAQLEPESRAAIQRADCLQESVDAAYARRDWAAVVDLARQQIDLLDRHLAQPNAPLGDAHFWAGIASYHTSRWDQAEEHFQSALQVAWALYPDGHGELANLTNLLATAKTERGENAEADALFREAVALQDRFGGGRANIFNNYAKLMVAQGDPVDAERIQEEAVGLLRGGRRLALAQQTLARIRIHLKKYDLAAAQMNEAIAGLIEHETLDQPRLGRAHLTLAEIHVAAGNLTQAAEALDKALDPTIGWGEDHPNVVEALLVRGELERKRGDAPAARAAYLRSLALADKYYGDDHPWTVEGRVELARLEVAAGDDAAARAHLETAVRSYESVRWRSATGIKRATAQVVSPYEDLAALLARAGEPDAAYRMVEHALGRSLSDLLRDSRQRPLSAEELATEAELNELLAGLEDRIANLREDPATTEPQMVEARRDLLDAQAESHSFQAQMDQRYPRMQGVIAPTAEIMTSMRPGEALVGWLDVAGPGGTAEAWAYCLRPGTGVAWRRLPPTAAREPAFWARLRDDLSGARRSALTGLQFKESTRDDLRRVHSERIAPLDDLLDGVEQFWLVPQGPLLGVPLEALLTADDRFLAETVTTGYTPSGSVLAWLREGSSSRSTQTALVLGDPPLQLAGLASPDDSWRAWSPELIAGLPPLVGARAEAATVADLVPESTILLGVDASEAELRRLLPRLGSFDLIHFATHALVDDRRPENSALVLAQVGLGGRGRRMRAPDQVLDDGVLTAQEIMRDWELNADLVTLSACRTGLGREAGGEGYIGLAHAFFRSGTSNLVTSLWSVEDEATKLLMTSFYRGLLVQKQSKAEALRAARRAVADFERDGTRPFQHPYYWAGFILMGAG